MTLLPRDFWSVLNERMRKKDEERWNAQGYCEVKLKPVLTGKIEGFRVNNSDLKSGTRIEDLPQIPVVCGWNVVWGYSGWVVRLSDGVTGSEGWYLKDLIDCGLYESDSQKNPYVCACAGTPGQWDALYINRQQLIEACRQAEQLTVFPK